MNAEKFMELMNTLPDDMIVTAVRSEYRRKRMPVYLIPAVAACFAVLIAAAIYPKLRTQAPEIAPPPVASAEATTSAATAVITTETTVSTAAQTGTMQSQSTAQSATMTKLSTVYTTAKAVVTTAAAKTTAPHRITAGTTATTMPQTTPTVHTERTKGTSAQTEEKRTTTTTEPPPEPLTVPLWAGYIIDASSIWDEDPTEMIFDFQSWFRVFPPVQPDPFFELSGQYELFCEEFSVPQAFDLTQNCCLEITIQTAYTKTAVIGCRYTQNGLTLTAAYLENGGFANQNIRYAIPLPEELTVLPENCCVEFLPVTDEAEYQARLTNNLTVEMNN